MSTAFEFSIDASHPSLPGHFPGRPIVPGVLLLDHVLGGIAAATGRPVATLRQVKFAAALRPGEAARVAFEVSGSPSVKFGVHAVREGRATLLVSGIVVLAAEAAATP
jgi:3-hydroxyacyl-[acyl-carrier-protein] dehydratase